MLSKLNNQGGKATPKDIEYLINKHMLTAPNMRNNYDWYLSDTSATNPYDPTSTTNVNIFRRTRAKAYTENVKVHNDFISKVVDQLIGYMGDVQFGADDDTIRALVLDFTLKNSLDDVLNEIIKYMTVCGYASIQLYRDPDTEEYGLAVVEPWKVVFLENSVNKVVYAFRIDEIQKDESNKAHLVEFYGLNTKQVFESSTLTQGYTEIESEIAGDRLNIFSPSVPFIQFKNNVEEKSDIEVLIPLQIDYDITLADESNDLRQNASAYMVTKGYQVSNDTILKTKEYGVFQLDDKDASVEYLVKPSYENPIQQHLDNLQKAIHTTGKDIDMTDEQFGGNLSGVAIKFKLMALENKAYMKEKKITSGLRSMWKALFQAIKLETGKEYDYLGVTAEFSRNLPVNMVEQAQILQSLLQTVDTMTALEMSKIIKDPQMVYDRIREQKDEEYMKYMEISEEDLNKAVNEDENNDESIPQQQ